MMWNGKKVLKAYLTVHGILQTGHSASPGFLQLTSHASPLEINLIYYSKLRMIGAIIHFDISLNSMHGDNITCTFRCTKESLMQTVFYIM
jgi:hypothetical protein